MHDGTAEFPQTAIQRRQACPALLALVKLKIDHVFQPFPLASQQKLDSFAGVDPLNPAVLLETPRAMADRYMHLYYNAVAMRAMLKHECAHALQFVMLLDRHFNMLGQQVIDCNDVRYEWSDWWDVAL